MPNDFKYGQLHRVVSIAEADFLYKISRFIIMPFVCNSRTYTRRLFNRLLQLTVVQNNQGDGNIVGVWLIFLKGKSGKECLGKSTIPKKDPKQPNQINTQHQPKLAKQSKLSKLHPEQCKKEVEKGLSLVPAPFSDVFRNFLPLSNNFIRKSSPLVCENTEK